MTLILNGKRASYYNNVRNPHSFKCGVDSTKKKMYASIIFISERAFLLSKNYFHRKK